MQIRRAFSSRAGRDVKDAEILRALLDHGIVVDRDELSEEEMSDKQMRGRGTLTWPSGERYDGDWCSDKKHGLWHLYGLYVRAPSRTAGRRRGS